VSEANDINPTGWTIHRTVRTAEAIQIVPGMRLGRDTMIHLRGDPPTVWYPWLPKSQVPPGTTMDQVDAYATRAPDEGEQ
jgi:hypothetical protein